MFIHRIHQSHWEKIQKILSFYTNVPIFNSNDRYTHQRQLLNTSPKSLYPQPVYWLVPVSPRVRLAADVNSSSDL